MSSEKNYLNDSYKSFFEDSLSVKDPELYKAIKDELIRQQQHIELIASENIVSQAVLEAQGSVLTNKYAEGYPGKRYYNGCEHVDVAENLANLADIYVNEAFSCSHRKHASVHSITKFIPSYSGIQLEAEVNSLIKITSNIKRPISCIIGGSKISTKITVIKNLIDKFDNIIFVGGMANNILKFKKYKIGNSIYEKNVDQIVSEIFYLSEKKNCKIFFPLDVSTGKSVDEKSTVKKLPEISNDDMILDIGPETIKMIKNIINNSNTILWNGPAGYFENPEFSKGSKEIAEQIIVRKKENKIYCVSGGGDTVAVLNNFGLVKDFDFVSTAGGAFLEFLEGKELPGIKALNS